MSSTALHLRSLPGPRKHARALVRAARTAFPPHYYAQADITAALKELWSGRRQNLGRLEQLHAAVRVDGRHLALPRSEYAKLQSFTERNDAFIRVAVELGERAISEALAAAGLEPECVDHIIVASVTGIAAPSVDARLCNRLGFRSDIKRTPIFGLGCVAGAAGIARAADYLRGHPDDVVVLLCVELCSLTWQEADTSIANMIATGLFGDGAAAVVLTGVDRTPSGAAAGQASRPAVLDTRSVFYPDTEEVMGWHVTGGGFRIVLSAQVAELVANHLRKDVDGFLADNGLGRADIDRLIMHPGGPRVLEAVARALEVPDAALGTSWDSLRAVGNLSSASVLTVLGAELDRAAPGELGLLAAMGPGFCSELVLLKW